MGRGDGPTVKCTTNGQILLGSRNINMENYFNMSFSKYIKYKCVYCIKKYHLSQVEIHYVICFNTLQQTPRR